MGVEQTMLRAATMLDTAASSIQRGLDTKVPRFFGKKAAQASIRSSFMEGAAQARAAVRQLEPLGEPYADVRASVDALVTEMDRANMVPRPPGMSIIISAHEPRFLRMRADLLRLRLELDARPAAAVQAELGREVDDLLRSSAAPFDSETRWRLGLISLLPEHQRPPLAPAAGSSIAEIVARDWPLDGPVMREWTNQQLGLAVRELVADPTFTKEAAAREARAIVQLPDDQVTTAKLRRLATLARLPDDLRPQLLDTPVPLQQRPLSHLGMTNRVPADDSSVRAKLDALRMRLEGEELAASGAVTRQSATDELVSILARSNDRITQQDLRRVSLLSRLPEHVRPPIPEKLPRHHRFEDMGLLGYSPLGSKAMAEVVDSARDHVLAHADPTSYARAVVDRLDAGESMELRVLRSLDQADPTALERHGILDRVAAQLRSRTDAGELADLRLLEVFDAHPQLLTRHGIDDQLLERQALIALSNAGTTRYDVAVRLPEYLAGARDRLAAAVVPDDLLPAREEALALAERNLARMDGTRRDTFGRHPDYAEVGRIAATIRLIDALQPAGSTLAW